MDACADQHSKFPTCLMGIFFVKNYNKISTFLSYRRITHFLLEERPLLLLPCIKLGDGLSLVEDRWRSDRLHGRTWLSLRWPLAVATTTDRRRLVLISGGNIRVTSLRP